MVGRPRSILSFGRKENFPRVIDGIKKTLKPGGVFSAMFFGPNHADMDYPIFRVSTEQLRDMFSDMDILSMREVDGTDAFGGRVGGVKGKRDNHIWVIARKRSA